MADLAANEDEAAKGKEAAVFKKPRLANGCFIGIQSSMCVSREKRLYR